MSRLSLLVICILLFVSDCKGAISDTRLCGDPTCSEPVSYAKTLIRYASDDARILSFQGNVKVTVFSKSAGSRPDLWGVEINGKRGYAPKDFIREYQVVKGQLEHLVSTRDDVVNALDGQDSQANGSLEESTPDNELKLPPFPNIGAAAEQMKDDIPLSSETLKPYEVADGTTIYYSTDAPTEPVPIQATTTDASVQPTMQSQLDPNSKNEDKKDVDKPNPSMVLPQPSTSSDVNTEKEDLEGSASEKIYKYLLSNFMSDEGSGEPAKEEDAETKSDESAESGQKVFIESTESGPVPISIDAAIQPQGSVVESDASPKHVSTEKPTLNESVEEDDEEGDDEDDDEDGQEDEEYVDSEETYSGESSPESTTISSPSSDDKNDGSLSFDETVELKRDISDENKPKNQDPNVDSPPSSIESDVKSAEPNINVVSEIVHDNTANTWNGGNTLPESGTKELKSLEQISDNLEQKDNASHEEAVEYKFNETVNGNVGVEISNTVESVDDNPHGTVPQSHGSNDEAVGQTTAQVTSSSNSDSSSSPLSTGQKLEMLSEIIVDPHPDIKSISTEEIADNFDDNNKVLPEKTNWNIIPDIVEDADKSFVVETVETDTIQYASIESENGGNGINIEIEPSVDRNDTNTSQSVDTSTVEPETENIPDDIPQTNVLEETEVSSDFTEDEAVPTTSSTTEDSTETSYIDMLNEDSPLNVVTDIPAIETEDSSEAATEYSSEAEPENISEAQSEDSPEVASEDIPDTSGGFFNDLFCSLFGTPPEEAETPVWEVVKESSGSETEDGAQNSAWNSVWSYTRKPDSIPANRQSDTPSSCLADSGIDPDCDKVLVPGNAPRVDSDNEAVLQVVSEQDPKMETWEYGGSSGMLSYIGITAISMVVIILGHWFIEKMRCDSLYIKKINDLERALLYAELESKNLKIDLEENQYKTSGIEESEKIALLEEQLLTVLDTNASLEEKNASLEEKTVGLQSSLDVATEAGLELNRMLSDLLSSNKGSESLIGSVNDLQQQLNSQQTTISNMKIVLNTKEAESESLRNNLTLSQGTIQSLERDLNQVTETLNELLVEKATQENQFKCTKDELDTQLKAKSEKADKLAKEIVVLRCNVIKIESEVCTRDIEMALLRECISQLKKDGTPDNEEFKQLFNVAKAKAACQRLMAEKDRLSDELQGEKDARKLLEGHTEVITKEVDLLRKAVEQSEKEKVEAVTKHAVLADYFKDKESQLHKELGYRDALYMQTKGDASMTHDEVKSLQEQLDSYKSQIDTLKKEIVDQERGLKSQILAFEKKSHENWLITRQAERKLQEAKLEAGLLRNRLTMAEKNASNIIQNDNTAIGKMSDREMQAANIGRGPTPPLYPLPLDMNVANSQAFATRVPPVANSGPSPINHPDDPYLLGTWPSVDSSPIPNSRSQPATPRSLPPRISPANNTDITFTLQDATNPASPFYGILSPGAPYDPFHGRPIQDRHNPELYHIMPLLPYMQGPTPVMLPPPVLPNLPASHDRRPPPLGRMSSPVGGRGHRRSPPPHRIVSPYDRSAASSPDHGRPYRRRSPSPSDSSPDSAPESRNYARRYARHYDYSPESSYRGRSRTPSPTGFRPISREASNNQGSNRSSNQSYESDESNRRGGRL